MFRGKREENCGPHSAPHTLIKIVARSPLFVRRQLAGVTGVESGREKQAEFALSEKQGGKDAEQGYLCCSADVTNLG